MPLFKRKKTQRKQPTTNIEQGKSYLAIDIGTEFIKTALIRLNKSNQVEIIGYDRTPQKHNSMRGAMIINIEQVVNSVDIAIGNAINQAEKMFPSEEARLPQAAIFGIGGELVKGVTIVVNYEREDPDYKVDQAEINDVLEQIREQAFANATQEISDDIGIPADQIVEINTIINSTSIDGVKVDNPLGFTGKMISYRIYATFAPKLHIDALKQVAESLQLQVISLTVVPYAISVGAKNSREEKFSGIFIDVGGGTTDIALVENGLIIGTNMFALGGRVFTKRIELQMNLDYLAAERMKIDYSDQKISNTESEGVKSALAKDINVWLDGVNLALTEFEDVKTYPSRIYLCGGGAMLPDIKAGLLEYPWLKLLPFTKFPKVSFLFPNQINDVIDLTRTASDPRDVTPLALARMLLDQSKQSSQS